MNRRALLLAVSVFLSSRGNAQQQPANTIAILHAKAVLVPGRPPVNDTSILIIDGRIQATGSNIAIPANTPLYDARGRLVTPGLMNSASQLALVETGTEDTTDAGINSGLFAESFDVQYALNPNSTLLPVARADGLTRAVVLPTGSAGSPFNGLGAVLRLNEGEDILDRPQAALVAEVGGMVAPRSGGSRSAQWMLIRAALDLARKPTPSSIDDPGHSPVLTPRNIAALKPVIDRRIPLVLIAYRESDLRQAIALADDYKIRIVLIGAEEGWRVASLLAAHHIPVVLDPYASTPATYDQMGARLDNAAILDRAGVVISFKAAFVHVSHNAGIAIREGAGVAAANGLPWDHAIQALTSNPAETWGIADHYGTLQPGQDADLVVWSGDPLEPVNAPDLVLIQGRQVSLETRQTQLEKRYSPPHSLDPKPPQYH